MKTSVDRKPQMTSNTSPTFSSLGRSPSIGPPAYTTDDLLAAKYQKISRWIHLVRVAMAAITFVASIAVIACVGASLRAYSNSRLEPEWILPLWPLNVDLRPSHAILGCGVSVALLSLAYLAVAFIPMVCRTVAITVVQHTDHNRAATKTAQYKPRLYRSLFPLPLRCPLYDHLRRGHHQQFGLQYFLRDPQFVDLQMAWL